MDGEDVQAEQPARADDADLAVETRYDPVSDCVEGPGLRIPAAFFREADRRKPGTLLALKPIGVGVVEVVEIRIKTSVTEVEHGVIARPQPPPRVMLPEHVAREIAAKRGVAAQKVE
jgi:hypothetical protein